MRLVVTSALIGLLAACSSGKVNVNDTTDTVVEIEQVNAADVSDSAPEDDQARIVDVFTKVEISGESKKFAEANCNTGEIRLIEPDNTTPSLKPMKWYGKTEFIEVGTESNQFFSAFGPIALQWMEEACSK